ITHFETCVTTRTSVFLATYPGLRCRPALPAHRKPGTILGLMLGTLASSTSTTASLSVTTSLMSIQVPTETPFTAWTQGVSRRYTTYGSLHPFMSDDTFRSVWFTFVSLQDYSCPGDCPLCGPSPAHTIWDGVTLAFHQKHLLPSLTPPTLSLPDTISRAEV
ncbi:hypothetical protein JB92DRAFT_3150854, partial [Gautieria morchelliformis]